MSLKGWVTWYPAGAAADIQTAYDTFVKCQYLTIFMVNYRVDMISYLYFYFCFCFFFIIQAESNIRLRYILFHALHNIQLQLISCII